MDFGLENECHSKDILSFSYKMLMPNDNFSTLKYFLVQHLLACKNCFKFVYPN